MNLTGETFAQMKKAYPLRCMSIFKSLARNSKRTRIGNDGVTKQKLMEKNKMNAQEEIETVDRDTLQKRIGYFERTIHSLCEAEEQETDFERLTKISQLIEDARYELISLQLELNGE